MENWSTQKSIIKHYGKSLYFFIVFIIANYSVLFAQSSVSLSGTAKDLEGKIIEFADVILLNKDSTVYKFSFIENGQFSLDQIDIGQYIIHVNSLDCAPFYQSINLIKNTTVDLVLIRSGIALDEISITARKKIFDVKNGNITFNIDNTILKSEPNTISIMSKIPYVQIAPGGESISIVGRGSPLIYHNNQRIDLIRMNNISVDDIESIEIINNPSAKYEAEGRSVILIKTKHNLEQGYKIDFSETLSQREFTNNFIALNSSLNIGKSAFKLNMGFNLLKPWEKAITRYDIINKGLSSNSEVIAIANRDDYLFGTGYYLPISDKDYFSIDYNMKLRRASGAINAHTVHNINNFIETRTENIDDRDYHNGILNYNKALEKGTLFMGIQFSSFTQSVVAFIENSFDQGDFESLQDRNQDFGINSYSARLDYETSFESGAKIEVGLNTTLSNAQTQQFISPFDNQVPKTRTDYDYDEQIHAAYTQVSHSFGFLDFSGGLRLEKAIVEGQFVGSSIPLIDRDNLYFLPKVQLSFPVDSLSSMTINYSRNINRPNFSNLSQIEVYFNPFLVFARNINLRPTLIHEIAANFQKNKSSLRLSFSYKTDPVNWSATYDESRNVFKTTLKNFDKMYGLSAILNVPLTYKNWTSFNTISMNLNKIEDDDAIQLSSKPYAYFYTNHSYKLPNKFSLSVNAWGFTKRNEGSYQRNALVVAGVGVSRVFFDTLSFTFNFNNIFNNRSFEELSNVNAVQSFNGFFVDSRELSLSIKYSIGEVKSKYKNKNISDENNRVE